MDNQQRNRNNGTFNDCNSSTFEMVIGQSNPYRNIRWQNVYSTPRNLRGRLAGDSYDKTDLT